MKFSRALVVAAALCAALFATQLTAVPSAEAAAGTVLCDGWAGCEAAGMTTHGYASANSTEYWKMVSGHNCTNYVAYMLVSAGMANVRPWTGNGNANGWGAPNAQMTDAVPTVGAVAWWDANKNGAGSSGHVAYVEQVFADHIVISEDNYGGDFHYRVVYANDKTWPTGFIHLKDATTSASFPAWRGRSLGQAVYTDQTKKQVLAASSLEPGSTAWVSLTFQNTGDSSWESTRVVTAGATSAIGGAGWLSPNTPVAQKQALVVTGGSATYGFPVTIPAVPDGTQFAETFTVVDSAGNPIPYASAQVTFTADSRVPFTSIPALGVSGTGKQGDYLAAASTGWAPVQPTFAFQWLRDGKAIPGATQWAYAPTDADVGRRVSLTMVSSAPGYLPVTQTAAWPNIIKSKYSNTLAKKKKLKVGAQIVSSNGVYKVVQGKAGNLAVVNRMTKKTVWSSKAHAKGAYTRLRSDGVLVTYSKTGKPIWNSKTKGKKVSYALVTNSGKLALYTAKGKVVWTSKKNK